MPHHNRHRPGPFNPEPTYGPAYFRRFVGTSAYFRLQLKGSFFPLDGYVKAVYGPDVCFVDEFGKEVWVNVSPGPKGRVVSVDLLHYRVH
jgi:hypothetical protein